ncbi:hypothetical protein W97_01346 [Coniosporium apollinis CBS 100218]|uniref:Vta1 C-terminal domain-containing protein n=1 Tax=Coniosporium apollinis (strain CBS 100218) TaxID=1168221 RepID=R7YJN9_CONA1|nr:uncharacterized protein W97_01346 [Coniosporium apollinis CBS 100218]EON62127.1 hypothetical protein W97_01346 [Coniosporium apollinis CBS 100218]
MAANIPGPLKTADIARFAMRSAQLANVDAVMTYWCRCDYYIVNQILSKGLHTADDESMAYTTALMDKLEQIKAQHPSNDAILDDVAAKAYVEQFALKTFDRADNAVRANKASAQTADTFRAAATFLDLLGTWGPLDPEISAKSKFAKYHALRIAKAIKAGEDPNLSNPVQEPPPQEAVAPALDPNDPEVQRINGATSAQRPLEDSAPPLSLPSPPLPDAPATVPSPATHQPPNGPLSQAGDVSPLAPTPDSRKGSVGGGYFPRLPATFASETAPPALPTAPADDVSMTEDPPQFIDPDPSSFYSQQNQQHPPPPPPPPQTQPPQVHAPAAAAWPPARQQQPPAPEPMVSHDVGTAGAYRTDDEAIASAAKHAKWAVSALNFEDVDTAVKELRIALRSLGAS